MLDYRGAAAKRGGLDLHDNIATAYTRRATLGQLTQHASKCQHAAGRVAVAYQDARW